MLPQAPKRGRITKVVEVDGRKFRVKQAPVREAAALVFQLFRSVGRPLVSLLAGGAMTIPAPDGGPDIRIGLAAMWKSPPQRAHLLGELAERAREVDDSIVDMLVTGLLVGKTEVQEEDEWTLLDSLEEVDDAIGDLQTLMQVLAAALEVTIRPFASASRTSGDTSPGKT